MNNTYHFTYQTKNLVNGKTYVGVHSTENLNDGYIGSGKLLKQAVKKYGKHNFTREILSFFDSKEEAYNEETYLVDNKWVLNENTYNLCIGGEGGIKVDVPWNKGKKLPPLTQEHRKKVSESLKGYDAPWKKLPKSAESNKKRSDSCPHKSKVYQYDLDGNFIMMHDSVTSCAKYHSKDKSYVTNVLSGKKRSCNGFQLRREYKDCIEPYIRRNHLNNIYQYNLSGDLIKVWASVSDASGCLGIDKNSIYRVLNGHRNYTNGFVFKKTIETNG